MLDWLEHGMVERRALIVLLVLMMVGAIPAWSVAEDAGEESDVFDLQLLDEVLTSEPGELRNVLSAAAEQFEEGNQAVAIQILDRVSRERGEILIPGSDARVRPFGRWAADLIRARGPSAIASYRQAAGSRAGALLADGPARLRPDELRHLADRFWLTAECRRAVLAEATLHMDAYRFHRAGWLLRELIRDHPDSGTKDADVVLRLVFVLARTGRVAEAKALLDDLDSSVAQSHPTLLAAVKGAVSSATAADKSDQRPVLARIRNAQAINAARVHPELPLLSPLVRVTDEDQQKPLTREQLIECWIQRPWLPTGEVTVEESGDEVALYYRSTIETIRTRTDRSEANWIRSDRYERRSPFEMAMRGTFLYPRPGSPQRFEERFFFGDPLGRKVRMIDGRLVILEGQGMINMVTSLNIFRFTARYSPAQNALVVLDPERGEVIGRYGLAFRPEPLATVGSEYADHWFTGIAFLSMPVPAGDQLLVAGRKRSDLFLMGLDRKGFVQGAPAREVIRWIRLLPPELQTTSGIGQPIDLLVVDGVVFALAHNQFVVAMDAKNGRGIFGVRYPPTDIPFVGQGPVADAERVRHLGWSEGFLGVDGDRLFAAPRDSRRLLVIDIAEGRLLSSAYPMGEGDQEVRLQWVCGLHDGRALIAASDRIMAWDHQTQTPAWTWQSRGRIGRALRDGQYLYVPTLVDGQSLLVVLDLSAEGRMVRRVPIDLPEGHAIMSLRAGEHHLFGWDLNQLWKLSPAALEGG
ncbi:MAG: hypothetical protein JJU36_15410 [Phycisphaeraceae bacterium]|nr:hypothetical protein [Phycisphaeraceae bacterium]